ncbi:MAG: hypothetical protein K2G31_06260 [Clostridia bacterium]|nr:hypothetical protein [Clostridia bacterium]
MDGNELKEIWQEEAYIFKGILFNNTEFAEGAEDRITYRFDCPEFEVLKKEYKIQEIAGNGTSFEKAVNLTRFFAPRLVHDGNFDNHISCNALELLRYSLNKPSCGINCLNKSKILQESCLALKIPARRVWIMPCSPYDMDNHVVTEIYDDTLSKWVMLDVTSNGYFIDAASVPLSVIEIRHKLALNEVCNFIKTVSECDKVFSDKEAESLYYEMYFAKNSFWYAVEKNNGFGDDKEGLYCIPKGFNRYAWTKQNLEYKLHCLPNNEAIKQRLKVINEVEYRRLSNISILSLAPQL